MKYDISIKKKYEQEYGYILARLPKKIGEGIISFLNENSYNHVNEIRIHKNTVITLIADSKNVKTNINVNERDMDETLNSLCQGSVYAHFDTIKDGYISIGKGIRAGICGRAVCKNGEIDGVCEISSINIRIPRMIYNASDKVFEILKNEDFNTSVLIYSAPGVGKTTIIRDLIFRLGKESLQKRISVIDTREEITTCMEAPPNTDVFISYPKGIGIEIATKSMTPEIIICDEISSEKEAQAILKAVHGGVRLIATAHAGSFSELEAKDILKPLISSGVFDYAVGVKRKYGSEKYEYELNLIGAKRHYEDEDYKDIPLAKRIIFTTSIGDTEE